MKLANYERYCIQFQKYDHIFDGKCRGKDQTTSFEGTRGGGFVFQAIWSSICNVQTYIYERVLWLVYSSGVFWEQNYVSSLLLLRYPASHVWLRVGVDGVGRGLGKT